MSDLLGDLRWRGLLHQSTDEEALARHLATPGRSIYCGFDPTADSLTIGNLLPITLLARFRQAGHRPVVLFGGATGQIGDPSFRSAERGLLDAEAAAANVQRHEATIGAFLATVDGPEPLYVNNLDWLGPMPMITFLRDVGKHFSVNDLLRRDSIRSRIEGEGQGMSYTEFSYALLQAYDFLHLYESRGVTVQVGASDQWGNIVGGADLVRRVHGGEGAHDVPDRGGSQTGESAHSGVHALTCPLVTKRDGTKFGKSESGAVWLSPDRTSPYSLYQFLVNLEDEMVPTFLRFYSLRPHEEIEALEKAQAEDPGARLGQRAIAAELCERLHGQQARERAEQTSAALFRGSVRELDLDQIEDGMADVPTASVPLARLGGEGADVVELLVATGLADSKAKARRFLADGAISLNGERFYGERSIGRDDLLHGAVVLLRRGKRNWAAVRAVP